MNITHYKEQNIGRTCLLLGVFLLIILGAGWALSYVFNNHDIFVFAVLFSLFSSGMSYWFADKLALAFARAEPIQREDNPKLGDMVQRLATAAGLPMPSLYITPDAQINAFATGRSPKHAAVAVTQGALAKLSAEELEGVLAHEMSHIANRDMLVSTVAVVLAGVISLLADMFLRITLWGGKSSGWGSDDRDSRRNWLMIAGIILSVLAPIGAMLIQFAISRQREALADVSSTELTHAPQGLIEALKKIAADRTPMLSAKASTAHLWIADPFKDKSPWWHTLFKTHPPLDERIAALEKMR